MSAEEITAEELETRAIDMMAWDGAAAMSACASADDPAAAYAAICAGRRDGDPALQSTWALPHHREPGMGPNAGGVRNSLSRLPQTDGLINADAAQAHLEAHLREIQAADGTRSVADKPFTPTVEPDTLVGSVLARDLEPSDVQVRDFAKRELDIKLAPFGVTINTLQGLEEFERGAFADTNPATVFLMGSEHEASLGIGQDGRPVLVRHPVGKALSITERPDAAYGTFRVAQTARGDEVLALAAEGIVAGASIEFRTVPGGTVIEQRNGRRVQIHKRIQLTGASTTYRPAFEQAGVVAVRSEAPQEEATSMADPNPAVVEAAPVEAPEAPVLDGVFTRMDEAIERFGSRFAERMDKLEERYRSSFTIPSEQPVLPQIGVGEWGSYVVKMLAGDRIPDNQHNRTVQDLIVSENAGVVPEAFISELRGVIDASRPFMESTRRLPTPSSGTTLRVPKIVTRPTVAKQAAEKNELSSGNTSITSDTFEVATYGGVGDLSLQLLKRSDPAFLDLYIRLLAEAYAIETDEAAVAALIDAIGNVATATALDPEALALGPAFTASFDAIKRGPDTIWLSTDAVGAFIDAKASTTNTPLYGNLGTSASAAGGITGTIYGLRAVHVPALDAHGAYAIVGPSSGFAWAEDGTYTLQVDVPSKAGRDVALVGMVWLIAWYPDAFSLYNVAS